MNLSRIICFSSLLLFFLCQDGHGQSLIISNINVIDVEKKKTKEDMDVYVNEGIITRLSKHEKSKTYPSEANVIDGTNQFLIPGFIDTHAHFAMGPIKISVENHKPVLSVELDTLLPKVSGGLLLSHGVTTARDPGCLLYTSPSPRDRTRSRMPSSA